MTFFQHSAEAFLACQLCGQSLEVSLIAAGVASIVDVGCIGAERSPTMAWLYHYMHHPPVEAVAYCCLFALLSVWAPWAWVIPASYFLHIGVDYFMHDQVSGAWYRFAYRVEYVADAVCLIALLIRFL